MTFPCNQAYKISNRSNYLLKYEIIGWLVRWLRFMTRNPLGTYMPNAKYEMKTIYYPIVYISQFVLTVCRTFQSEVCKFISDKAQQITTFCLKWKNIKFH